MSEHNFSQVPIHLIKTNKDLLKSSTDYQATESVPVMPLMPHNRQPAGRCIGNEIFRRYMSGTLDLEYARDKTVEALHTVRNKEPLSPEHAYILSVLFPLVPEVDAAIVRSGVLVAQGHLLAKLTPMEIEAIRLLVARFLVAEEEYKDHPKT